MAHTKGPWTLDRYRDTRDFVIVDAERNVITESEAAGPHAEANARLIAAAPDLLEMLKDVLDLLISGGTFDECLDANCTCVQQRARAAIAKAEAPTDCIGCDGYVLSAAEAPYCPSCARERAKA